MGAGRSGRCHRAREGHHAVASLRRDRSARAAVEPAENVEIVADRFRRRCGFVESRDFAVTPIAGSRRSLGSADRYRICLIAIARLRSCGPRAALLLIVRGSTASQREAPARDCWFRRRAVVSARAPARRRGRCANTPKSRCASNGGMNTVDFGYFVGVVPNVGYPSADQTSVVPRLIDAPVCGPVCATAVCHER